MANDNETLADVSAWCRDIARSYRNSAAIYNKIEIEGIKVCDYFDELANRIEAAAKRAEDTVGNAAAIRTALKRLRDASRDFYNQILNSQYSGILDKYTCAKQGFPAVLDVRAAIPAANAALAAAPAVECPPSNVAALREALLWVIDRINAALIDGKMECEETIDKCKSALATPPRNCDVGTPAEQNKRYEHYCFTHRTMERCCQDCPLLPEPSCELAWAQMPYVAEEGGAK